jgi:predicted  nucleic acid-binding Zn-ribbon protein
MGEFVTHGDLRSAISDVRSEIRSLERKLDAEIERLERKIQEVRNMLEHLMNEIARQFSTFNQSLLDIKTVTGEVRSAVESGDEAIRSSVDTVNATSRDGLKKVSTGVAVVDVLKARSEANQTGVTIARSIEEVSDRRKQANEAVELKRQEFDKHFELIAEGFEKQVRVIGQHVVEISERTFPLLEELCVDESEHGEVSKLVEESQVAITEERSRRLREGKKKLDLEKLSQFQRLRHELSGFLSDESAVRLVEAPTEEVPGELPGFDIPAIAVALLQNEFEPRGGGRMKVFCLDAKGENCYSSPSVSSDFRDLEENIVKACGTLDAGLGSSIPSEIVSKLKESCGRLAHLGMLSEEDARLVCEHLDSYPLKWMVFKED